MNNPPDIDSTTDASDRQAYDQTILVYLLLLLHVLFGITGLIAVIICHMKRKVTRDTVFATHTTWQIWTFWAGAIGYVAGFYYLNRNGTYTILILSLCWCLYRVAKGWHYARGRRSIGPGVYP